MPPQQWVCLNGVVMPADEASVGVFDAGFLQGIGLFTTMKARRGTIFRLQEHVERLCRSAEVLGWTRVPDRESLSDDARRLLAQSRLLDARLRITVSVGSLHAREGEPPGLTALITVAAEERYPASLYENGCSVLVSGSRQSSADPLAGHKTTSYYPRLLSLRLAHVHGGFEALWLTPDGNVAEGAISSVFIVKGETLVTPPLDAPVLPGTARALVLEIARAEGLAFEERMVPLAELLAADEVFLTNAMMDVMPVVRVDRKPIGPERVGDFTYEMIQLYAERIEQECGRG